MLKNLTFLVITGILASGCNNTTGGTDSDPDSTSNTSSNTSTAGTTTDTTMSGSTGGTGSSTGSSGEPGTTTSPTTGTSEPATSSSSTGGGSDYGNCGWLPEAKGYSCGGESGVSDPDGIHPIDCPRELPSLGDPCDETTPIKEAGCCVKGGIIETGEAYYCLKGKITSDVCL